VLHAVPFGQQHTPLMQGLAPQPKPHPPQLLGLVRRLAQRPKQITWTASGLAQAHVPLSHTPSSPHEKPQSPQLLESPCVSTQVVPHFVPVAHAQPPKMQVRSPWHTFPQPLQLSLSVSGLTQTPLHRIRGGKQPLWHDPFWQVWPAEQPWPHSPQFASSLRVSVQASPQQSGALPAAGQTPPAPHSIPHSPPWQVWP
jgi:hypothetical protein